MAVLNNTGPVRPPPTAVTFGLVRMLHKGDKGKPGKVIGDPLPDGTVPDRWAVSEFSTQRVLEVFGPDHYRVDWYDSAGARIAGKTFRVAHPAAKGAKIERASRGRPSTSRRRDDDEDDPDDAEPRGRARNGESISLRELLTMQAEQRRDEERRQDRADERWRLQAEAAQQRDREFMAHILGALVQTRTQPEASSDLLRRELSLEIRQGMQRMREELGNVEIEEPDDRDPPADVGEGMARVGSALLGELEERAPQLINELIPNVAEWLKQKGFTPSADIAAQMTGRAAPNGRGHAGQS